MVPASGSVNKAYSVGSYLRESRESRGIDLEDAARVTRIGKNYLTALEEDRFDALPNPAYTKGFLRVYAGFLNLSGDDVVAMYETATSPPGVEYFEPTGRMDHRRTESVSRPRQGRWIFPLLLFALVIAAALFSRDKEPATENISPAISALPVPAGTVAIQQPLSTAARPTGGTAVPADKLPRDLPAAGTEIRHEGIILKLKVNQDSSLNITIDGLITQQYDLKSGDLIEWKADRMIALDMGNGGGVEAEMNGKPLKPFAEPGKAAHVVLKADVPLP